MKVNQHNKRVYRIDRYARRAIKASGVIVIASMVVMFLFLMWVTLPLFRQTSITQIATGQSSNLVNAPLELGVFSGAQGFYSIAADGAILWHTVDQVIPLMTFQDELLVLSSVGHHRYNLLWQSGLVSYIQIQPPSATFQQPLIKKLDFAVPPSFEKSQHLALQLVDSATAQAVFADAQGQLRHQTYRFSPGEQSVEAKDLEHGFEGQIADLVLGSKGRWLFVGTTAGELAVWDLASKAHTPLQQVPAGSIAGPITQMTMINGDFSVAVGNLAGALQTWGVTPREKGFQLSRLHQLQPLDGGILQLTASNHDKTLLSLSRKGTLALDYTTSERRMLQVPSSAEAAFIKAALAQDNHTLLVLDAQGKLLRWHLDLPYPEVSFKTLWRPIWYEGYPNPTYTWQSSAATSDFEPKISLPPLIFGSLKGTFYSMLFAIPISLLAAMYVSHLMHARLRSLIKPIVELMAGLPSVVIGFVAALVLAPILTHNLLGLCLILPVFAGLLILLLTLGRRALEKLTGKEFLIAIPLGALVIWGAFELGSWIDLSVFEGHFNLWLFESFGLHVEQRNALVVAIALGFAVMPLIFTIAEDALHNVPLQYTAASLALGSSKWQTLRYVVMPIARPGMIAAIMIGFARAVGETMIVLMVTGNTPIMSMSFLSGMRTLSANIAIEISEAPSNSMLFRVLFLSAFLLFVMTFVINTIAEFIRQRLQQKYSQL